MNKIILCVALPFILLSSDAIAQQDVVQEDYGVNATDTWLDGFWTMVEAYDEECDNETETYFQFACDNLRSVIITEADKRIALSQHTAAAFQRQGIASTVILILVIIIVLSGILLAAFQLWVAAKKGGPQGTSELEASAHKVRITSSSVGLIVLTLSWLFFYLYVMEIYRINVIPLG